MDETIRTPRSRQHTEFSGALTPKSWQNASGADFSDLLRALQTEYLRCVQKCDALCEDNMKLRMAMSKQPRVVDTTKENAKDVFYLGNTSSTSTDAGPYPSDGSSLPVKRRASSDESPREAPQEEGLPRIAKPLFSEASSVRSRPCPSDSSTLSRCQFLDESFKLVKEVTQESKVPTEGSWGASSETGLSPQNKGCSTKANCSCSDDSLKRLGVIHHRKESEGHLEAWQSELIDAFAKIDVEGRGSIDMEQLREVLMAAGVPQARLMRLLRSADTDGSDCIEYDEWVNVITRRGSEEWGSVSEALARRRFSGVSTIKQDARPMLMLKPLSALRMAWDISILSLCIYIAVASPLSLAWEDTLQQQTNDILSLIDVCMNIIIILDIVLNFRTGYYDEEHTLFMDPKLAGKRYLKTWFALDAFSSLPFDKANIFFTFNMQIFKILKLTKLLKILKLIRPRTIDFEELSDVLDDLSHTRLVQVINRRWSVGLKAFLLCHWMACGAKLVDEGFLTTYQDVHDKFGAEYLASLYWAMTTLTTVGYGDIVPTSDNERMYTIATMVVGGAFYGYVVGAITSMVSSNDLNTTAYYDRMDNIQAWLSHHKLPIEMKRTLRRYFKAYHSERSAAAYHRVWLDLSPELQREVGDYIMSDDVKHNPLFDGVSMVSIVRLQSVLRTFVASSGTTITQKGETGVAMYIISSGNLHMQETIKGADIKLGPGHSFGEEVLLQYAEVYEYTVTVIEKSRLQMILESDFVELFHTMPNEIQRMKRNLEELCPPWLREPEAVGMTPKLSAIYSDSLTDSMSSARWTSCMSKSTSFGR